MITDFEITVIDRLTKEVLALRRVLDHVRDRHDNSGACICEGKSSDNWRRDHGYTNGEKCVTGQILAVYDEEMK